MFNSIWQDIKQQFSYGNSLTRLIIVNVAVFVCINLVHLVLVLIEHDAPAPSFKPLYQFFSISSDWQHNLTHPWVIVTHMFLHIEFLHILGNMLLLYTFGRIVGDLLGDRRVLPIYLLGGLAGALVYFGLAQVSTTWAFGGYAVGASAAVMAMLLAAGMTAPDYIVSLFFLGEIKLKFIVAVLVFLDLIAISNNFNSGGSFAHLGGALMGALIANRLQHGTDLTATLSRLLASIAAFWKKMQTARQSSAPKTGYRRPEPRRPQPQQQQRSNRRPGASSDNTPQLSHQEKIDAILDKIKKSGYESLSVAEKEFLFDASKK